MNRHAGTVLAVLGMAASASAEPLPAAASKSTRFHLAWQAPEGCPTGAEVVRQVEQLVIDPLDSLLSAPLEVNGTVVGAPEGFRLTLTLREAGEPRSRELTAPSCAELAGAAALVLALTIDPALFAKKAPPPATEGQGPPAPPPYVPPIVNPPALPAVPSTCERPEPSTTWVTALGASLAVGMWRSATTGPSLLGAVEHRSFRAELILSTSAGEWQSSPRAASFRSWIGAMRGCWLVSSSSLGFGPCAGLEGGALQGSGSGVSVGRSATLPWFAPALGALVRLRVRPNAEVLLRGDALKPLIPNGFELAGQSVYRFREASFAGVFGAFVGVVWP